MTPDEVKKIREAYKTLFASDDGQLVLDDMRSRFHMEQPVFSSDAMEMAYLEGQRSVVLIVQNMMKDMDNNLKEMMTDGR